MDQDQNPHRVVRHLIDEAIAAMWGQLARSHNFTNMAEHREVGELGNGIAEQPIHSYCSGRVAGFEIIPDCGTVLLSFRRPVDIHA